MPLLFTIPNESTARSINSSANDEALGTVFMAMPHKAPSKARRKFKLKPKATIAQAIGAFGEVDTSVLASVSSGIYDASTYEEEYGLSAKDAKAAAARDEAAWQDPAPLLKALDAAEVVLADAAVAEALFSDYSDSQDVLPAIREMAAMVRDAIAKGAVKVCMEWDGSEL